VRRATEAQLNLSSDVGYRVRISHAGSRTYMSGVQRPLKRTRECASRITAPGKRH